MKFSKTMAALVVSVIALPSITAAQATGGAPLSALLDGAQEVPGPGDADGTGVGTVTVNPGQERVCYTLTVSNIAPATAAHIHNAPAGANGPIVVVLDAPSSGSSQGCVSVDRELARDMVRNPENYYFNVHNADFPPGAVRGQIGR